MAKFKVGDKVYLTKPIKRHNSDALEWHPSMNALLGNILTVIGVDLDDNTYSCKFEDTYCWCCESWLTKVGGEVLLTEPEKIYDGLKTEEVKPINWEQRRWDLLCMTLAHRKVPSIEGVIKSVDNVIEKYKQTLK